MRAPPILLVEDNADDEFLTLHAFRRNKIANEIVVVRDGQEALDYLFLQGAHAERDPTVVPQMMLLDLKLPKVSGIEVLQRVRQDPRTQFLPVVILTSSREEQDVLAGYRLHANSYIRKPVDFDQFSDVVRQLGAYWLVLNTLPPAVASTP